MASAAATGGAVPPVGAPAVGAGAGSASAASAASTALAAAQLERGKAFVQVLSCVLSRLVAANDAVADPGPITKFHALRPPSISIGDYCSRIYKYASCSPECFVLALVFIDRLIQRNSLLLTSLNVHRIIITAVMLAAKFFDDAYFNNAYYAKVGGVPTSEVNALELEFLFSINFSLHVPTDVYEKYYGELGELCLGDGPRPRGRSHTGVCSRYASGRLEPHCSFPRLLSIVSCSIFALPLSRHLTSLPVAPSLSARWLQETTWAWVYRQSCSHTTRATARALLQPSLTPGRSCGTRA